MLKTELPALGRRCRPGDRRPTWRMRPVGQTEAVRHAIVSKGKGENDGAVFYDYRIVLAVKNIKMKGRGT